MKTKKFKWSLFNKALIGIISILIPILIAFLLSYHRNKEFAKQRILDDLTIIAESYEGQVHLFLDKLKQRTQDFASDGFIKSQLLKNIHGRKSSFATLSEHLIKNKAVLDKDIKTIHVLSLEGRVVASTNNQAIGKDFSGEPFFTQGKDAVTIVESLVEDGGLPELAISAPVFTKDAHNLIGVIVNFIQISKLDTILSGEYVENLGAISQYKKGKWKTMEVYLVNRNKFMITKSLFVKDAVLRQVVDTPPIAAGLTANKEMTGFYKDYRGIMVAGASMYIPPLKWVLLAEIDEDEILAPAKEMFINALITATIVVGMIVLIFMVYIKKVVKPLRIISNAAKNIACGNLDVVIPYKTSDEIGMLCETFNSMSRDIKARTTALVKSEENLRKSELKFRTVADFTWDWEFWISPQRRFIYVSPACERISGYKPVEFIESETLFLSIVHPEDYDSVQMEIENAFLQNIQTNFNFRIIRKDRTIRWVSMAYQPITDDDKTFHGVRGSLRDITERKQADDELRKAHEQNEQLIAAIPSILIYIDDDDRVIEWNKTAERVFGISSADAVGKPFGECGIPWQDRGVVEQILACRNTAQATRIDDVRFKNPLGKVGFLGITVNPILETGKRQFTLLIIGSDITQRKIMESQLIQAQKLESIGQLAAGIAHEINTPTQYVGDNTRFLNDAFSDLCKVIEKYRKILTVCKTGSVPDNLIREVEAAEKEADVEYLTEEIPRAIQQSLEGVERVSKIVRAMKEFSHPGTGEKTPIDINKAIESTITVARNEWKYVAEMVTIFDTSLPLIPCLPDEFNQAILNIIINAAHAIGDVVDNGNKGKGIITVSTHRNGNSVEVRIQDTGTGIPEAVRPKIFDPFFTTKGVGKGTGQGLAIAHDIIVKKHGGSISFETEMGKGTAFIIRIPIDDNHSERLN